MPKIGKAKASKWTLAITAIFPNGHLNAQPRTFEENVSGFDAKSPLNHINELYRPIKSGDLYSLYYQHENQKLELKLNQKLLGSLNNPNANQYFKIWFGSEPFNAKLKQQLLN